MVVRARVKTVDFILSDDIMRILMGFRELSDKQCNLIKPHLPSQPIVGIKRADELTVIN